ncbi:MAG: hypothetical protein GX974_04680 [Clostridiales bacterium]|nr:hypothetical protein [Clostridiales bacterium]
MSNAECKNADCAIRILTSNIWGNSQTFNRMKNLANTFFTIQPDVIGLQEVNKIIRNEESNIFKLLSPDYKEVDVHIEDGEDNFTPLLYNHERWMVQDCGFHRYSGANDMGSKSITWVVFEGLLNKERFVVMNTHFYWTSDEIGRETRIVNSKELIECVEDIRAKYPVPVFVMGDLNCKISEPPIQNLFDFGFYNAWDSASKSRTDVNSHHKYPILDEDKGLFVDGPKPVGTHEDAIDHIFTLGKGVTIESYNTITTQDVLDASDHCPIYIEFFLD